MKKIIILSLFFILLSPIYSLTNWSQFSLRYFTTDAQNDIEIVTGASQDADKINTEGKFGLQYEHELSGKISDKISFSITDDIFFSEKSHERRNSFLTNDLKIGVLYKHETTYLKLKLNNRYFNSGETKYLILPGIAQNTQKQMVYSAVLHFRQNIGKLNFSFYSSLRDLEYKYIILEDDVITFRDDDDELESSNASDYDSYTNAKLSYQITNHLTAFSRLYYKDDLNESSVYDMTNIGGGFKYDNYIDLFSSIKAEVQYYNNISNVINNEQDHNLVMQLRYSRRFMNGMSGFISYINRSCYDEETSKVYRVSNMLRVHTMYSYSLGNLNNSYILGGIKLNPENHGTLGFIEQNQHLYKGLYSTANIKYSLDLFTSYSLKVEYYINPLQSFWIKDELIDYYKIHKQNLIFIGSTLIF
jgi:hypothetical protein